MMDDAIATRDRLRELTGEGPAPSINDMIVKACALALRRLPRVKASHADRRLIVHSRITIGFAVARADALVVRVVHDADTRTLGAIDLRDAAPRRVCARRQVRPEAVSGATFTVSTSICKGSPQFNR